MTIREVLVIAEQKPQITAEPDGSFALNLGDADQRLTIILNHEQLTAVRDDAAALLLIVPTPLGLIEAAG